jgi:hypothetical protein
MTTKKQQTVAETLQNIEQYVSRFDLLSRQPLLLVFALYQFIVGIILTISPALFLRLSSMYHKYDIIEGIVAHITVTTTSY